MGIIQDHKTYIVAEIGINHNGDVDLALELIKLAHDAGFDCVKFQKRTIDLVYTQEELDAPRESPWGATNRQQKEGLEFGKDDYDQIALFCKTLGIHWTASPWDIPSVDFLLQYDIPYIKIASASATNKSLVEHCAKTGLPLFVSTGGTDYPMVSKILGFGHGKVECLYHCCAAYPAKLEDLNLRAISTLRRAFGEVPHIGYSGHETGVPPSVMAVVLGAASVERHITLNRAMYGSDQAASLEPEGFRRLVREIRAWEEACGNGALKIFDSEVPVMQKLRKVNNT